MKIGILSMQKVRNYGSFLQAFALKKTLESFRNEVEFVDILSGRQILGYELTPMWRLKEIIKCYFNIHIVNRRQYSVGLKKSFESFFRELETEKHTLNTYDCVVIGSDEVFNIAQHSTWGYTSQLFGNISNTKKIISYAGSFGQTNLKLIRDNNLTQDMTNSLKKMSAISVRDENSKKIVEDLLQTVPFINIDPVLMFDFSENIRDISERDYVLIYSYPNRVKEKKAIKAFAKKHNKKIFSIGSFYEWADKILLPHPFEVLAYFKNADYIITDTFHGTIISIKYNKRFVTLVRGSNSNKLKSLLKFMKLEKQTAENSEDIENNLLRKIDYSETNEIIKTETQKSIDYLRKNL